MSGIRFCGSSQFPIHAVRGNEMGARDLFSAEFPGDVLCDHAEPFSVMPDKRILHVKIKYRTIDHSAVRPLRTLRHRQPDPESVGGIAPIIEKDPTVGRHAGGGIGHDCRIPASRNRVQNRFRQETPRSPGRIGGRQPNPNPLIDTVYETPFGNRRPVIGERNVIEQPSLSVREYPRIVCHPTVPVGGISGGQHRFAEPERPCHLRGIRPDNFRAQQITDVHRIPHAPAGCVKMVSPGRIRRRTAAPDPVITHLESVFTIQFLKRKTAFHLRDILPVSGCLKPGRFCDAAASHPPEFFSGKVGKKIMPRCG